MRFTRITTLLAAPAIFSSAAIAAEESLREVPFDRVLLQDEFWSPRLDRQRTVLVPFAFGKTEEAVAHLQAAADVLAGKHLDNPPAPHRYNTSDLYKVMEGAAYLLKSKRDPGIEAKMDHITDVIAASQKPDGYIYPAHVIGNGSAKDEMGDKPYTFEVHSHELYNVGHLYEAAVAYYRATGKRKLLDVAEKNARHVNHVFFEGDPAYNDGKPVNQAPGHQEIEMALVKMYEVTGEQLYLDMARRFLEVRGVTYVPHGEGTMAPSYAQQHAPVLEQKDPVGHAVRATYMYSAMADVGRLEKDPAYGRALETIWTNMVDKLIHITGGLGAIHGIEGFGPDYELPNADAYNETCAAVGNVFFNHRLFLNQRDARYLDVAEVSLFNNVLAGVNLEGNRFFYVNPLEADGHRPFNQGVPGRAEWFHTACCPTNLARLLPQVAGMIYAVDSSDLYVAHYAGCSTELEVGGAKVKVSQRTGYPFSGKVELTLGPDAPVDFALRLRIPTWTGDRFMPGKLYGFLDQAPSSRFTVTVNGKPENATMEKGFAVIRRTWKAGDQVNLELAMPVRFAGCDPRVKANVDRLAVTCGPLVYCAEGVDNDGGVLNTFVSAPLPASQLQRSQQDIGGLAKVTALSFPAQRLSEGKAKDGTLKMIPYYAWNNRGAGEMEIWLPRKKEMAQPGAEDSPFKAVRASHTFEKDLADAIGDLRSPSNSKDGSIPRWTSWNQTGKPQWIEADLKKPGKLRSVGLYWFDDGGGVQLPESWEVETRHDGKWEPMKLYVTDAYQRAKDQYNVVHPASAIPVDGLRIKMTPKGNAAVGILEMRVEMEE
ncbi:glycoside hydrolase family 127 protein [Luteolibacter luteus]|uniref:F5/8 type C domain-containing protein n=1 Tax=Luteolibacter luteus TaxID=2728835 RepID=A0A858RDX1_9BACT|nr:beta-L-arabinofuranosidase domain-containing protein [Luteolibacter luteus]QJE94520.1 hypothetical protein HHL09_01545 [Luteolibacter luteus]